MVLWVHGIAVEDAPIGLGRGEPSVVGSPECFGDACSVDIAVRSELVNFDALAA